MKTLGIIGGVGPGSSAKLYQKIIEKCHKLHAPARPHILLDSIPIPLEVEKNLLLHGKGEAFIPFLKESAKRLENSGADHIILACNTLHIFENQIQSTLSNDSFLSLTEAVSDKLIKQGIKRIGILGSSVTVNEVFSKRLTSQGIQTSIPEPQGQLHLDEIIRRIVTDSWDTEDKKRVQHIINDLEENCDAVLLACTDFSVLDLSSNLPIIDTVELLAEHITKKL